MNDSRSTAEAFGAKIKVTLPDQTLHLVIGRGRSPAPVILSHNGQLVFQVPDSFAILALLSVSASFVVRQHPSIAHIGPVSIDSKRFNHFLELLSLNNNALDSARRDISPTDPD